MFAKVRPGNVEENIASVLRARKDAAPDVAIPHRGVHLQCR
jgi:hypothetical protein